MAHFAKVVENKVVEVIVAEQEFIDTLTGEWIKTSYNTLNGVHLLGGTPLRQNFAATNYHYDRDADVFYSQKPFDSWTLNEETWTWVAPIAYPSSGNHTWNEEDQTWDAVETE